MLPRSIVLLVCLTGFVAAAPAPLPRRDKRNADERTWSAPVGGLRARLLAPRNRYQLGGTVQLVLEIQNVSGGKLAIEEPHLSHYVFAPNHSQHGWSVSGEQVDRGGMRRDRQNAVDASQIRSRSPVELEAGQTLRIELDVSTSRADIKQQARREGDERPQELHFPNAYTPGTYLFRVRFDNRSGRDDKASRPLASPPVSIELTK